MELTVISPRGILCQAEVEKVMIPGSLGAFTVLPNHAPLISSLQKGMIRYTTKGEEKEMAVTGGIVEVKQNKIRIFTEQ